MDRSLLIILVALGGLAYLFSQSPDAPGPTPTPTPAPVVDLLAAFRANPSTEQARKHASDFGELCKSLADGVEYDGRKPEPRIKTGVQMDDLRITTREQQMQGWSFSSIYPQLGPTIDGYMQEHVGTNGGPLDSAQRARWVAAFRGLSDSAFYAASQL